MSLFLRALKSALIIPQVGLIIVTSTGLGIYGGLSIDNRLETMPASSIILGLSGLIVGIVAAYRLLMNEGKQGSNGSSKNNDE